MSKFPIPEAALKQHIALLGKTRSGKSSVMRGLVEHLLDRQRPVCIIDPKGDWWGIKLAADGIIRERSSKRLARDRPSAGRSAGRHDTFSASSGSAAGLITCPSLSLGCAPSIRNVN